MKEHNRNRLSVIADRYAARQIEKQSGDNDAIAAFLSVREGVIRPVFEEIAAALQAAGHAPRVVFDAASEVPSIELLLGIRGTEAEPGADLVGFSVIQRRAVSEVLAYLVVRPPPMDLQRFSSAAEITADQVEQLTIDAIEHVFACRSV